MVSFTVFKPTNTFKVSLIFTISNFSFSFPGKPLNYFQKLDLENSWPNPISTKKRYTEKMNQIA